MNTEINFLEKQPNKKNLPLLLGGLFIVSLALVISLLFYQKNHHATQIESLHSKRTTMEMSITENQTDRANELRLKKLQEQIQNLQTESVPNLALYKEVLGLLSSFDQLTYFEYMNKHEFIMEAEFTSLEDVASYIVKLLERTYILDISLSQISNSGLVYQATLTVELDVDVLKEELGIND